MIRLLCNLLPKSSLFMLTYVPFYSPCLCNLYNVQFCVSNFVLSGWCFIHTLQKQHFVYICWQLDVRGGRVSRLSPAGRLCSHV